MPGTESPSLPPDILAVREDRSDLEKRGQAARIASDALSVYFAGGPSYRLGERTYSFRTPIAMLVPKGTLDCDLQEGRVNGIFALFDGHNMLKRHRTRKGIVMVSFASERLPCPEFKELTAAEAQEIAQPLRELAAIRDMRPTGQLRRASLLYQALASYCDSADGTTGTGVHRDAALLRNLIEQHAFEQLPLEDICRELEISSSHVGMLFKAAFGISPVRFRTRLRMQKARELLVSSKLNVGQVASSVGYTDPLYFSRVFRREFGITPSSLVHGFKQKRR